METFIKLLFDGATGSAFPEADVLFAQSPPVGFAAVLAPCIIP